MLAYRLNNLIFFFFFFLFIFYFFFFFFFCPPLLVFIRLAVLNRRGSEQLTGDFGGLRMVEYKKMKSISKTPEDYVKRIIFLFSRRN